MSAAKKPHRTTAPKAVVSPPLDLTPAEMSLLMAYRAMDDEGREVTDKMASFQSARWPRLPVRLLRLVAAGGAQRERKVPN